MPYTLITALIFALVAILTVSWVGLVVAALLAIWGFSLSA